MPAPGGHFVNRCVTIVLRPPPTTAGRRSRRRCLWLTSERDADAGMLHALSTVEPAHVSFTGTRQIISTSGKSVDRD